MRLFLEYLVFAGVAKFLQLLPLQWVRGIAHGTANFIFYILPFRRSLTVAQLRRAFPDKVQHAVEEIALGSYRNLLTTIFELMWTPQLEEDRLQEILHIRTPEIITDAHARGNGVILMSGHFGNWEWLSNGVAKILGIPFHIIVRPVHNPGVNTLVNRYRTRFINTTVPMKESIREMLSTLQNGGVVAMLADQSAPKESIFVDFMGSPASTFEGPARFSLKTGAPIIMGFTIRRGDGNYDVHMEMVPTEDLDGPTEQNIRILTERHVAVLERMIASHPEHWLWLHRRWKHTPDEQLAPLPS
ncbi:MAG: hypothetical protein CL946_09930 [Ectothiorhodospiraceae bacterium]|nr:hypothetical protein [Ectothiorhodospiraceae bacterium]